MDGPRPQALLDDGETAATAAAASALPGGARLLSNVPYGPAARQRMDVYLPAQPDHAPVLVMVHGGAWMVGSKASPNVVDNKIAHWLPRGFILVSIDYRLWPEADPMEQASDVAAALAAVQSRARAWGGDPDRSILMGHSAGAHLVALLGAAPALAREAGAAPWRATIALDSAALNLPVLMRLPHLPFYDKVFGSDPAYWASVSPMQRLTPDAPPILLVCSSQRRLSCLQSRNFADHARNSGVSATLLEQDLTHAQVNAELGLPGAYTDAVDDFIANAAGIK